MVDSKGLVAKNRAAPYDATKGLFAKEVPPLSNNLLGEYSWRVRLLSFAELPPVDIVNFVKPSAIFGLSAQPNSFTPAIISCVAALHANPLIFALSNPTSKSECTAADAYEYSDGRAIFAR